MFIINVREIIVNSLIQLKMSGKYDFELNFDKSGNLSFSIYICTSGNVVFQKEHLPVTVVPTENDSQEIIEIAQVFNKLFTYI